MNPSASPFPDGVPTTAQTRGAESAATPARVDPHIGAGHRSHSWRWWVLAVLCFSVLIINLDNTVLNVALPTLVRELGATSSELQWIVDAYALTFGGLLLVFGSLADHVGRKRTFVAGLLSFAAGSAWAAFSGSVSMLIVARASMGVGAALMMPSTLSIITDVFVHEDERQRAIGFWAGTSGVGFALGPIIGGLLLSHFWWGSVFLINVPIALIGVACAVPLVPDSKNPRAKKPDAIGGALSIVGLGLVLWSIIEAPSRGWSSTVVIATATAGLAVIGGFIMWERTTTHPMLNLEFFGRRSFSMAVSCIGLGAFALLGTLFLLTQFLQFDLGYSALAAGVRMLPIAAALAVISPGSSVLVQRIGIKLVTALGLLLAAAGLYLTSRLTIQSTYTDVLLGMFIIGAGAALVIPTVSGSVMSSVPRGDTGVGSATNGTFIQCGGALGVAVLGSLLSTRYQDKMAKAVAPFHVPRSVEQVIVGSLGAALGLAARVGGSTGELLARAARSAFIDGAGLALRVAAVVALGGAVLALVLLPRRAEHPPSDETEPGESVR